MLDINGVELNVGDKVIYTYASDGYLRKGEVVKFTKQGITLGTMYYWTDWKTKQSMSEFRTTNLQGANGRIMKLG